jgi:hypothetical protein
MTATDKAIEIAPQLISFQPDQTADGQHFLKIFFHTGNIGSFVVATTPIQAEMLAASLWSYAEQIAEHERAHADHFC